MNLAAAGESNTKRGTAKENGVMKTQGILHRTAISHNMPITYGKLMKQNLLEASFRKFIS